ncbi:hypothetical protein [Salsuginibacillus kocurii]|uniref:hypothetical protein n=1 Tax=Salsuginibacillus kocurii TaxID=427078 RepID=UPI00035F7B74|nr:hypothetical protein [Salsuginibacillus kocurii]
MIVHDLVESKELFAEKTKDDCFVIYEKMENTDASVKTDGTICLKEAETQEVVHILRGKGEHSLSRVCEYTLNKNETSIEVILEKVQAEHAEIFA